ncbi:MAG: hypothetical protein ACRD4U_03890 [Candidatus Acidiferrales bacterium]
MSTARWALILALLFVAGLSAQEATDAPSGLKVVKRLCVEKFGGNETEATQAREMVFAKLFKTKRFVLTENCEKADAVLKGAFLQSSEQRVRGESESMEFGKAAATSSGSVSGTVFSSGGGHVSGSSSGAAAAVRGADSETLVSAETLSQASLTLRIVDKEGDILWAHTEENKGAKTKTPLGFVVDRAVNQLVRDLDKDKEGTKAEPR